MARYELTCGIQRKAAKAVFYGPEGIGKSTLAAQMPSPVFIDVEGGTNQLPVARLPRPTSWAMLLDEVRAVRRGEVGCQTLVVDTADAAESLCKAQVLATNKWPSIETPGYGKGFNSVVEEFAKLLDLLSEVAERGTNVVLLGHSIVANVTRPDESAYTTFNLNLIDRKNASASALVKQWADMVLFLDYEVFVTVDKTGKGQADGGRRVVRCTHSPTWEAKNRYGLPDRLPLDDATAARIASLMAGGESLDPANVPEATHERASSPVSHATVPEGAKESPGQQESAQAPTAYARPGYPSRLSRLMDLMERDQVTDAELRRVVAARGTYPEDCPVERYEQDFCDFMVAKWPGLLAKIKTNRIPVPFSETEPE